MDLPLPFEPIIPVREFFSRNGAFMLLALIVLYKMGDAFAGTFTMTFLLRGVDFTLTELGTVKKVVEVASTLLGLFIAGTLMLRMNLFKSLLLFGILQAISGFQDP